MNLDRVSVKTWNKFKLADRLIQAGEEPRLACKRAMISLNWYEKIKREADKANAAKTS